MSKNMSKNGSDHLSAEWKRVQEEVARRGQTVGLKAANLEELQKLKQALDKKIGRKIQETKDTKERTESTSQKAGEQPEKAGEPEKTGEPEKAGAPEKTGKPEKVGSSEIELEIPSFIPIEDSPVRTHLKKFAPQIFDLWESFTKTQAGHQTLIPESTKILQNIQAIIHQVFTENTFQNEALKQYLDTLDKDDRLMVRSTGMEDSVDFANPGGNESVAGVPCTAEAISEAMGIVVASYFSEKSIGQRLRGKQQVISKDAFMPVLVQKMIGEKLGGEPKPEPKNIVKSGVIHVTPTGVRIDVAPGHGELVVDSQGPSDTYYVNMDSGVVHEQRMVKTHRLVASLGKLLTVSNPDKLATAPSLSDREARWIAKKAEEVRQHYKLPMDLEFVFDPVKQKFNLVQARPIQQAPIVSEETLEKQKTATTDGSSGAEKKGFAEKSEKRKDPRLDMPSSVPPEKMMDFLELHDKHQIEITEGSVVTPAKAAVKLVTDPKQLIVTDTIAKAYALFGDPKKTYNTQAIAVVIREFSHKATHEAAYFHSLGIPILQMKEKQRIESWMQVSPFVLMVDPQRSQVVNWTRHLTETGQMKDLSQAEKELRDQGFIREGLFKSPERMQEKAIPYGFQKLKAIPGIREKLDVRVIGEVKALGDLIHDAQSSDQAIAVDAFKALLILLNPLVEGRDLIGIKIVDKGQLTKIIKKSIIGIEAATPGNTQGAKEALGNLVMIFGKFAKMKGQEEDSPHYAVFRSAIITCAEIQQLLEKIEKMDKASPEWNDAQVVLLRLASSLESFLRSPKESQFISDSVKQILAEELDIKRALAMAGDVKLDAEEFEYYVEFMKFQKYALNLALGKAWGEFALEACRDPSRRQLLASMVKFSSTHFIESDWINRVFKRQVEFANAPKQTSKATLLFQAFQAMKQKEKKLEKSFPTFERLAATEAIPVEKRKMQRILKGMSEEGIKTAQELETLNFAKVQLALNTWGNPIRVKAWADPNNFVALYQGFVKDLVPLIDQLTITPDMQPLTKNAVLQAVQKLTEIIDQSIKSLKGSHEYIQNTELQVKRFTTMLDHYRQLMENWITVVSKNTDLVKKLPRIRGEAVRNDAIAVIRDIFKKLEERNESDQLKSSDNFSVASAAINGPEYVDFYFSYSMKNRMTKEDLFTLFHQNILACTSVLGSEHQIPMEDLPPVLQPLIRACKENMQLLSTQHNYPKLTFEFNKPLRVHSAKFTIEYDVSTKKIKIYNKFFGFNVAERMDIIASLANLEAEFWGIQQQGKAKFNQDNLTLEYIYQFDVLKLPTLPDQIFASIQDFCAITFDKDPREAGQALDQRPWLNNILNRHPGFELRMINSLKAFPVLREDLIFIFFQKIMRDPKQYNEQVIIDCMENFSQETAKKVIEKILINSNHKNMMHAFSKKYLPTKKWGNSSYTMFHFLIGSMTADELNKYMEFHHIDCEQYPGILNIALARAASTSPNDLSVFRLLKQRGAKFDVFSGEVLEMPAGSNKYFKSQQIRDIVIDEFLENPEKQKLKLQVDLFDLLIPHLETKSMEGTVLQLIEKGISFEKLRPHTLARVLESPALVRRYKEKMKRNFHSFQTWERSNILLGLLKTGEVPEVIEFLIQSGFKFSDDGFVGTIYQNIISDKALSVPAIRKFWFDFVTAQPKPKYDDYIVLTLSEQDDPDYLRRPGRMEIFSDFFDYALRGRLNFSAGGKNFNYQKFMLMTEQRIADPIFKIQLLQFFNKKVMPREGWVWPQIDEDDMKAIDKYRKFYFNHAPWLAAAIFNAIPDPSGIHLSFDEWLHYLQGNQDLDIINSAKDLPGRFYAANKEDFLNSLVHEIQTVALEAKDKKEIFFQKLSAIMKQPLVKGDVASALDKLFDQCILSPSSGNNLAIIKFMVQELKYPVANETSPHPKFELRNNLDDIRFKELQGEPDSFRWRMILNQENLHFLLDKKYFETKSGEDFETLSQILPELRLLVVGVNQNKPAFIQKLVKEIQELAMNPTDNPEEQFRRKRENFIRVFNVIKNHPALKKDLDFALQNLFDGCLAYSSIPRYETLIKFMVQELQYPISTASSPHPRFETVLEEGRGKIFKEVDGEPPSYRFNMILQDKDLHFLLDKRFFQAKPGEKFEDLVPAADTKGLKDRVGPKS